MWPLVNIPKVKLLFLKHDLIKKGEVVGGFCCKNENEIGKKQIRLANGIKGGNKYSM